MLVARVFQVTKMTDAAATSQHPSNITADRLWTVLQQVGLHDYVKAQTLGLDAILDEVRVYACPCPSHCLEG